MCFTRHGFACTFSCERGSLSMRHHNLFAATLPKLHTELVTVEISWTFGVLGFVCADKLHMYCGVYTHLFLYCPQHWDEYSIQSIWIDLPCLLMSWIKFWNTMAFDLLSLPLIVFYALLGFTTYWYLKLARPRNAPPGPMGIIQSHLMLHTARVFGWKNICNRRK